MKIKSTVALTFCIGILGGISAANAVDKKMEKSEKVTQAQGFGELTIEELNKHIAAGDVTILDCRTEKMYQNGHIPGAIYFRAAKEKGIESVLPESKDALIVSYCGGPGCGWWRGGANTIKKLGYTNVKHLPAGIRGWKSSNQTIEK